MKHVPGKGTKVYLKAWQMNAFSPRGRCNSSHLTRHGLQISPAEAQGATASTASAAEAKAQGSGATQTPAASVAESPAPTRVAEGKGEAPKAPGTAPSTFAALAANVAPFAIVTTSKHLWLGSLANGTAKTSTNGLRLVRPS